MAKLKTKNGAGWDIAADFAQINSRITALEGDMAEVQDSLSSMMYTDAKQITVGASAYGDVTFSVPGFPEGFIPIPVLATVGAALTRYGNISLNVIERTSDSVTIRVFNASASGSVSPAVRVICISNHMFGQ